MVHNNVTTSRYCGNRWCVQCNRIRTAKQIALYGKALEEMSNPLFLTLTVRNPQVFNGQVFGIGILENTYEDMYKKMVKIKDLARKQGRILQLIMKFEVSVTNALHYGEVHPHLHIIIDNIFPINVANRNGVYDLNELMQDETNLTNAEFVLKHWMRLNDGIQLSAQDIRIADTKSIYELFKYMCKLFVKVGNDFVFPARYMDYIFSEMKDRKLFKVWDLERVKVVKEDVEKLQSQINDFEVEDGLYRWNETNYFNVSRNEFFFSTQSPLDNNNDYSDGDGIELVSFPISESLKKLSDNLKQGYEVTCIKTRNK